MKKETKPMIYQLLTIIALLAGAIQLQAENKKEVVTICYDSWPPAKISPQPTGNENLRNGFIVDMLRDIYVRNGYEVKLLGMPYIRALSDVENGNCDLEPATVPNTTRNGLYPKIPSYSSKYVFFSKKKSTFKYKDVNSLVGFKLGHVPAYDYSPMDKDLQNYIEMGGKGVSTTFGDESVKKNFLKLQEGSIDIFCEDKNVGLFLLQNLKATEDIKISGELKKNLKLYPFYSSKNIEKSRKLIEIFEKEMHLKRSLVDNYVNNYIGKK